MLESELLLPVSMKDRTGLIRYVPASPIAYVRMLLSCPLPQRCVRIFPKVLLEGITTLRYIHPVSCLLVLVLASFRISGEVV